MKAVDTFDSARRTRFSTYACRCIENFSLVKRKSPSASHDMWQRRRAFVMESSYFNYSAKRRAAFIPFSALCPYFICDVPFRCRVDFRYSSSVRLTTELAVLENASPNVRQQVGSSGRDTTPGQPNACITSSCEMVTPSPLRTNAMMRVSSRKLYEIFGFTGHLSIRCWMSLSQPGVSMMSGY